MPPKKKKAAPLKPCAENGKTCIYKFGKCTVCKNPEFHPVKGKKGKAKKEAKANPEAEAAKTAQEEAERKEAEKRAAEAAARAKETNDRLKKEAEEKAAMEAKKAEALKPDANGTYHIELTELQKVLTVVHDSGKTALIVDPSGKAATFLEYNDAKVMDVKGIFLTVGIHKTKSAEEMKEDMRKQLVTTIKYGQTLHLNMRDGATDLNAYDDENFWPLDKIFTPGSFKTEESCGAIITEEDKDPDLKAFVMRGEHRVVVSTLFEEDDVEDFLKESIPLSKCAKIVVAQPK